MLEYFENLEDKEIQANILDNISSFDYQLGNFEESLRAQEKAIKLFKDLGQVYPTFLITSYKMYNLKKLGMEDDIKKLEAEMIDFLAQNKNENTYGLITATMARGYRGSGRYALAIEYLLKSISIFEMLCAHKKIRTSTFLRILPPQGSASTNSAMYAFYLIKKIITNKVNFLLIGAVRLIYNDNFKVFLDRINLLLLS